MIKLRLECRRQSRNSQGNDNTNSTKGLQISIDDKLRQSLLLGQVGQKIYIKQTSQLKKMDIKIACAFLAFRNLDVIKMSLESIIEESEACEYDVDIYIIENHSEFSEVEISPYLDGLVKSKKVHGYVKLNQNITNNTYHLLIDCEIIDPDKYSHIIFSDGDIFVPKGTIKEQLNILNTCPETISCGVSVDYESWSLSSKLDQAKDLKKKRDHALTLNKPYVAVPSGFWFAMFKTTDYLRIYKIINANGLRVHDGIIQRLVRFLYRREWVQTRLSVGRELHRELVNSSYSERSVKKDFQRTLIESGHAEKGYELALYYHRKPANGIYTQADKGIPINHKIDLLNPTQAKTYDFDFITQQTVKDTSKYLPIDRLYIARKIPPIERCENLTCLIRYGIGTSFFVEETNSLFLQMRDGFLNPLKGPVGFPPLQKSSISAIYMDGFLLQTVITDINCQTFLRSCVEALAIDGYMRIAVLQEEAISANAGTELIKNLCRYAFIDYKPEMETDNKDLRSILKERNAFINHQWLKQLDNKSDTKLEIKRIEAHKAEINPIDPSFQWIASISYYLYVYKRGYIN